MDWTVKDNMVNGLFFCATSHKQQKGQYSVCVGRSGNVRDRSENVRDRSENVRDRSENVRDRSGNVRDRSENVRGRCGGGQAGPALFLAGPFREGVCRCRDVANT